MQASLRGHYSVLFHIDFFFFLPIINNKQILIIDNQTEQKKPMSNIILIYKKTHHYKQPIAIYKQIYSMKRMNGNFFNINFTLAQIVFLPDNFYKNERSDVIN